MELIGAVCLLVYAALVAKAASPSIAQASAGLPAAASGGPSELETVCTVEQARHAFLRSPDAPVRCSLGAGSSGREAVVYSLVEAIDFFSGPSEIE